MIRLKEIQDSLFHLLFPHVCAGCGSDMLNESSTLCLKCLSLLPETDFEAQPDNPVEKKFWGRLPLAGASAQFYFTRESLMQRLMHQFKYRANKDLGMQLGRIMGQSLQASGRFDADALIPLPLFVSKEKKRGFNQAAVLCEGIGESMGIPVLKNVVVRSRHSDTQTKKGRIERWQNIEGKFVLVNPQAIANAHILLVDDVVTTGATIEACGAELLKAPNVILSIATLCSAAH
jgi:ComF family protein